MGWHQPTPARLRGRDAVPASVTSVVTSRPEAWCAAGKSFGVCLLQQGMGSLSLLERRAQKVHVRSRLPKVSNRVLSD